MRTTVDLDPSMLERAKRLALKQRRTLSALLGDALAAYLGSQRSSAKDPPFELIVRGRVNARFPSAAEMIATEEEEEIAALAVPGAGRRAAP
jgi:predicted transcriptional regulator